MIALPYGRLPVPKQLRKHLMQIGVHAETMTGETRVAATPEPR
jgi:hypothetical protein